MPGLVVLTDGKAKDRHNREVMRVLALLRADGVQHFALHHIRDGGQDPQVPIALQGKYYDIGYIAEDGEVFLIEVMRLNLHGEGKNP